MNQPNMRVWDRMALHEFRRIRARIQPYIRMTPLVPSEIENVFLKLENLQYTHSFKVRGAFARIVELVDDDDRRTILAVSAGNHGQAVARAAATFKRACTVIVPESAPKAKIDAIQGYGIDLQVRGANYDEAEAISKLRHPHIVQLFEVGEHEVEAGLPRPYFTLEFVEGGTLAPRQKGLQQLRVRDFRSGAQKGCSAEAPEHVVHGVGSPVGRLDSIDIVPGTGRARLLIWIARVIKEDLVARAVKRTRPHQYFISSFLPSVIRGLHARDDSLLLGVLAQTRWQLRRWRTLPTRYVAPHYRLLSRRIVAQLHAAGKLVITWTVNDRRRMLRAASLGVDGIISDDPRLLVETLRQ